MPKASRNDIYEAVIRKRVAQVLEEQEAAFEQEHREDTREELCAYLCGCAQQLGYTPRYKEVIGWRIIAREFGSWKAALREADLGPEDGCPITNLLRIQEETKKQKEIYRQKKAEKQRVYRQRLKAGDKRNGREPIEGSRINREELL